MRYLVVPLFGLALACGAGDKPSATPPAAGDIAGGDSDQGDPLEPCEPGQLRDGHGNCVTICTGNDDCEPDEVCNVPLGLCVPAPPNNTCDPDNCGPGHECPPSGEGACIPIDGWCGSDGDCSLTERCENNECISRAGDVVMMCQTDQDCWDQGALLLTCQAGVCVGCVDDIQCGLDGSGRCVLGACVIADLGTVGECLDANCPDGSRCSLITGECQTICGADEDCLEDESCLPVANLCVPKYGCDVPEDCMVEGMQCIAGLCVGCASDADCLATETCMLVAGIDLGACFPRLDASACDTVTCEAGYLCDPADGSCYPEDGTCASAADCRSGQTCNFLHFCSGCAADGDCRPQQRCILTTCIQI